MLHFLRYFTVILVISTGLISCDDTLPRIEELPSPDVDFTYSVSDDTYRLDYYVGASVKFESTSAASGTCTWDFGDGTTATGTSVTHKYTSWRIVEVTGTVYVYLSSDFRCSPVGCLLSTHGFV